MKIKLRHNEDIILIRYFKGLSLRYNKINTSYQVVYAGRCYYASSELDHTLSFWKSEVKRIFGYDTHRNLLDGSVYGKMITYKKWLEGYLNETK